MKTLFLTVSAIILSTTAAIQATSYALDHKKVPSITATDALSLAQKLSKKFKLKNHYISNLSLGANKKGEGSGWNISIQHSSGSIYCIYDTPSSSLSIDVFNNNEERIRFSASYHKGKISPLKKEEFKEDVFPSAEEKE